MASPVVSPPTIPGTGKGDILAGLRGGLKRAELKAALAGERRAIHSSFLCLMLLSEKCGSSRSGQSEEAGD